MPKPPVPTQPPAMPTIPVDLGKLVEAVTEMRTSLTWAIKVGYAVIALAFPAFGYLAYSQIQDGKALSRLEAQQGVLPAIATGVKEILKQLPSPVPQKMGENDIPPQPPGWVGTQFENPSVAAQTMTKNPDSTAPVVVYTVDQNAAKSWGQMGGVPK